MQAMCTKEERQAQEKFWTELTKLGLRAEGKLSTEPLADIAPHLVGRG